MRYIDVTWIHSDPEYPIRLISEIGDDQFETRKLEFYSSGRVDHASDKANSGDTRLGEAPVPTLNEINLDSEFSGKEISCSQFESLWENHANQKT
ncbi:MAG: hypothetical protein AAFY98_08710 [Verrucomicrobiota bacterium]